MGNKSSLLYLKQVFLLIQRNDCMDTSHYINNNDLQRWSPYHLGLVWFSGAKEEADKCAIVYSRLPANSNQWTDPITISVRDGYSNQNPVLFFDNTSNILHFP